MHKSDPIYSENVFRPIYELRTSLSWMTGGALTPLLSAAYTGASSLTTAFAISAGMVGYGTYYGVKSIPLLKRQLNLTTNKKIFMKTSELRKINNLKRRMVGTDKEKKKDERRTYLGRGFAWGSEHANRAYQVMDMDTDMSQVDVPFILKPLIKAMSKETEELGGKPWIHGMGDEKPIMVKDSNWYGHTIITGNVGSGKTTLLRLMSLNALHLGNVLVVLDPKNDDQWKDSIKRELEYLGMGEKFYHLHPAHPSRSVRIPLLNTYTRHTEIADRVAPLMGTTGSGKAFEDFAYDIIYKTTMALDYLGEPVRMTRISQVVSSNRRGLALRVLRQYFEETLGQGWEERLQRQFDEYSPERLEGMAGYYHDHLFEEHPSKVVDGMITFSLHEQGHYSKMVVSLIPILTRLTADPLDELLSPVDNPEVDDPRPIVDLNDVVETGGCLYISLDSLTDGTTASDLSKIILAELAAIAGRRYNSGDKQGCRVTLANDEVHASIENNNAIMNLLAQGRASLFELILSTQTISDLEAKTDVATANRILGLCNNFITMRTTDPRTQEYATAQFSKASVSSNQVRTGTFTDTASSLMAFSAGFQETLTKEREDAFPANLFGDLPILQYVARLADGKRLKMRLPIIIDDDECEDVAEWAINEEY
jgi:conjugal transfer pilus assembly protein TraD